MKKAVFLDRDGVINEMVYNPEFGTVDSPLSPKEFKFFKGVSQAVSLLKKKGFLVIIVSNQPTIAKGKMTLALLEKIDEKMKKELDLDGIYYCLHHPYAKVKKYLKDCNCRKPKPGLLKKSAKDFNINLSVSYMIGDGVTDIQAGKRAGCKTIFIGSLKAYWREAMQKRNVKPDFIAISLLEAVKIIK